jgi:hypothetical protein
MSTGKVEGWEGIRFLIPLVSLKDIFIHHNLPKRP